MEDDDAANAAPVTTVLLRRAVREGDSARRPQWLSGHRPPLHHARTPATSIAGPQLAAPHPS